jgi:hypothetical protein
MGSLQQFNTVTIRQSVQKLLKQFSHLVTLQQSLQKARSQPGSDTLDEMLGTDYFVTTVTRQIRKHTFFANV